MRYKQCYDMNTALAVNKELENGSIELNGNKAFVLQFYADFKRESVMNCIVHVHTQIRREAWHKNKFGTRQVSFLNSS